MKLHLSCSKLLIISAELIQGVVGGLVNGGLILERGINDQTKKVFQNKLHISADQNTF